MKRFFLGLLILGSVAVLSMSYLDKQNGAGDQQEIQAKVKAYQEAYNQKNVKSLSSFWAEDVIYVNPRAGSTIEGKGALLDEFNRLFSERKKVHLDTTIESIQFPSNDQAVVKGVANLTDPNNPSSESNFMVTFEKREGQWVMTKISEVEVYSSDSKNEQLKELSWLVGEWEEEEENAKFASSTKWDLDEQFLVNNFELYLHDNVELKGKQIIGVDPEKNQVTSWVFDSHGGYGEGRWKKDGNQWTIENVYYFADGSRGSSIERYTVNSDNDITWESIHRNVEGEHLPNVGPVSLSRKKG